MTRPLRPADLVPGRMYFSPSGRPNADDSFALDPEALQTIATMRGAPIVQPEFAARFGVAAA